MDPVTAVQFVQDVVDACARSDCVVTCRLMLLDEPVAKLRAELADGSFIEMFHNADTSKYSFAWIAGGRRIFGADNTRGWHIHPISDPASHEVHAPVSFHEFLAEVEKHCAMD